MYPYYNAHLIGLNEALIEKWKTLLPKIAQLSPESEAFDSELETFFDDHQIKVIAKKQFVAWLFLQKERGNLSQENLDELARLLIKKYIVVGVSSEFFRADNSWAKHLLMQYIPADFYQQLLGQKPIDFELPLFKIFIAAFKGSAIKPTSGSLLSHIIVSAITTMLPPTLLANNVITPDVVTSAEPRLKTMRQNGCYKNLTDIEFFMALQLAEQADLTDDQSALMLAYRQHLNKLIQYLVKNNVIQSEAYNADDNELNKEALLTLHLHLLTIRLSYEVNQVLTQIKDSPNLSIQERITRLLDQGLSTLRLFAMTANNPYNSRNEFYKHLVTLLTLEILYRQHCTGTGGKAVNYKIYLKQTVFIERKTTVPTGMKLMLDHNRLCLDDSLTALSGMLVAAGVSATQTKTGIFNGARSPDTQAFYEKMAFYGPVISEIQSQQGYTIQHTK